MTFTIGADPEVFVTKNGKPFPALGLVKGTKESPEPVEHGAIQRDGMALEFNIDPVDHHDFASFNRNVVAVMRQLKAAAVAAEPGVNLSIKSVQDFGEDMMAAMPDEAKELGCDPDYNAYTLEENPRPDGEVSFRTAAGHIHIGWGADIPVDNDEHIEICANFVKMLDACVGTLSVLMDPDPRRRELYGKAGAFRPKPYGVEYRTPSNAWLINKTNRQLLFLAVQNAIYKMQIGVDLERQYGYDEEFIQRIINTSDIPLCREVLMRMGGAQANYARTFFFPKTELFNNG